MFRTANHLATLFRFGLTKLAIRLGLAHIASSIGRFYCNLLGKWCFVGKTSFRFESFKRLICAFRPSLARACPLICFSVRIVRLQAIYFSYFCFTFSSLFAANFLKHCALHLPLAYLTPRLCIVYTEFASNTILNAITSHTQYTNKNNNNYYHLLENANKRRIKNSLNTNKCYAL